MDRLPVLRRFPNGREQCLQRRIVIREDPSVPGELAHHLVQRCDGVRRVDRPADLRQELEQRNDVVPIPRDSLEIMGQGTLAVLS